MLCGELIGLINSINYFNSFSRMISGHNVTTELDHQIRCLCGQLNSLVEKIAAQHSDWMGSAMDTPVGGRD